MIIKMEIRNELYTIKEYGKQFELFVNYENDNTTYYIGKFDNINECLELAKKGLIPIF